MHLTNDRTSGAPRLSERARELVARIESGEIDPLTGLALFADALASREQSGKE